MSLRDSLYRVESQKSKVESGMLIRFDASHPIFSGHFPGEPIVPGACLMQIAEELLSEQLHKPIRWTAVRNLKFRQVVTPNMPIVFHLTMREDNTCSVLITHLDTPHAQFTATYLCPDTVL